MKYLKKTNLAIILPSIIFSLSLFANEQISPIEEKKPGLCKIIDNYIIHEWEGLFEEGLSKEDKKIMLFNAISKNKVFLGLSRLEQQSFLSIVGSASAIVNENKDIGLDEIRKRSEDKCIVNMHIASKKVNERVYACNIKARLNAAVYKEKQRGVSYKEINKILEDLDDNDSLKKLWFKEAIKKIYVDLITLKYDDEIEIYEKCLVNDLF